MCDIKEKEIKILIIKWDIRKTSILDLGSNHKEKVGECNISKFEYVINERKKKKAPKVYMVSTEEVFKKILHSLNIL